MNLIDIRMVGTQILGFLLLLWGLRTWAWGPLTKQLEARRQKIAGEFAEAGLQLAESPAAMAVVALFDGRNERECFPSAFAQFGQSHDIARQRSTGERPAGTEISLWPNARLALQPG